ncbi:MAG: hypothetical protein AAGH74_06565 [Pseudomonadota bacterium]
MRWKRRLTTNATGLAPLTESQVFAAEQFGASDDRGRWCLTEQSLAVLLIGALGGSVLLWVAVLAVL